METGNTIHIYNYVKSVANKTMEVATNNYFGIQLKADAAMFMDMISP